MLWWFGLGRGCWIGTSGRFWDWGPGGAEGIGTPLGYDVGWWDQREPLERGFFPGGVTVCVVAACLSVSTDTRMDTGTGLTGLDS